MQGAPEQGAEPAGAEFADGGVDGNDASHLEGGFDLGVGFSGVEGVVGVTEDFDLGLDDLELAGVAVGFHLAVGGEGLSGMEAALKVGAIEPEALNGGAAGAEGEFEDGDGAGAEEGGAAHFADDGCHLAGLELGDGLGIGAIFVAEREIEEKVFDGVNAFFGEAFGDARTDALGILNTGSERENLGAYASGGSGHCAARILTTAFGEWRWEWWEKKPIP